MNLKLGEMQSRLMTARIAAYHAVHLLDGGIPCDAEFINAKLINTEYALDSARNAMEIFAARGLQKWYNIERYLRDATHVCPPAGTSDIKQLRLGQVAASVYGPQWSAGLADRPRTPGVLARITRRRRTSPQTARLHWRSSAKRTPVAHVSLSPP